MKSIIIFIFLLNAVNLITSFAHAQTNSYEPLTFLDENSLIDELHAIKDRPNNNQDGALKLYDHYIQLSEKNNWQQSLLYAEVGKMEMRTEFRHRNISYDKIEELKQTAIQLDKPVVLVRLEVVELINLYEQEKIDQVNKLQTILLDKVESVEDSRVKGDVYAQIAYSKYRQQDFLGALSSGEKAYSAYSSAGHIDGIAKVYNQLAIINSNMENYDAAINYYTKSLELALEQNHQYNAMISYHNIGKAYYRSEKFEQAKEALEKSVEVSIKIGSTIGKVHSHSAIASIYSDQAKWEQAIALYLQILDDLNEIESPRLLIRTLLGISKCYIAIEDLRAASHYMDQASVLRSQMKSSAEVLLHNDLKSRLAFANGNYKESAMLLRENQELREQRFQEERSKEIQRYNFEFQTKLSAVENEALRYQNALKNLELDKQARKNDMWFLFAALFVVILICLVSVLLIKIRHSNQFKQLAFIDTLTSSPNRRDILQHVETLFQQHLTNQTVFSVGIVDLDKFKSLNDTFGHVAGDNVLKAFAQVCKDNLRNVDRFGRYGGEEWLFCFINNEPEILRSIFERLREALNAMSIEGIPDDHVITFSMGIAQIDADKDKTIQDTINRADENLYLAKNQGRDRIVF